MFNNHDDELSTKNLTHNTQDNTLDVIKGVDELIHWLKQNLEHSDHSEEAHHIGRFGFFRHDETSTEHYAVFLLPNNFNEITTNKIRETQLDQFTIDAVIRLHKTQKPNNIKLWYYDPRDRASPLSVRSTIENFFKTTFNLETPLIDPPKQQLTEKVMHTYVRNYINNEALPKNHNSLTLEKLKQAPLDIEPEKAKKLAPPT